MPNALDDVRAVLRNQAFEEIIENADQAASYCRSIGEAAYRGDDLTVAVHILQLRAVCVSLIRLYNEDIHGPPLGRLAKADSQDQRSGDVVA